MSDLSTSLSVPRDAVRSGQARPAMAMLDQAKALAAQPAVRRTLPFAGAIAAIGAAALAWTVLSTPPQRTLYAELGDSEKASVAQALDKASISYKLDPATGAITVNEDDIYKARMVVASDGSVAAPSNGTEMLDSMPIGASRVVEAERLRAGRERELERTIMEIDGVESVRVHLAQPEKSVFVRDSSPPRASVMLKLARGRQLATGQINAIVNLVTGSVPALSAEDVKVVDQRGQLLTDEKVGDSSLETQTRLEEKMRSQIAQLLTPIYGDGNFSTEVQVELETNATTSARESWNKDGVLRSESSASTTTTNGAGPGYGVPGTLSNTPPPATEVVKPAPATPPATPPASGQTPPANGTAAPATGAPAAANGDAPGDQNTTKTYEIGREVAVSNSAPGGIKRLSVAVVVSAAGKPAKPADMAQLSKLISAAVGADPSRGDQVEVMVRKFQDTTPAPVPFYEQGWFAMALRNGVALIGVLLIAFFGLRPAVAAMRRKAASPAGDGPADTPAKVSRGARRFTEQLEQMPLAEQLGLAQRYMTERPDSAVAAIRQMLGEDEPLGKTGAA
jgi:flagellar M-ring protein FliF